MKENEIQASFRAWLDKMGVVYINPRMDKISTIKVGMPDFCLTMQGRCLFIEVKTEKGRVRPGQTEVFMDILMRAGMVVQICRSVEECVRTAQEWLGTVDPLAAVFTLPTHKDASTGIPGGKEAKWEVDGSRVRQTELFSPVNGAATPTTKTPDPILTAFVQAKAEEIDAEIMGAGPVDGTEGSEEWRLSYQADKVRSERLTREHGQAFLDNIPHTSERIGEWQGQKWVVRKDKRGREFMLRPATVNDLTRLGGKA